MCGVFAAQLGNADIMQPGLVQLQPNLDDFMDTIEPLHGRFIEIHS